MRAEQAAKAEISHRCDAYIGALVSLVVSQQSDIKHSSPLLHFNRKVVDYKSRLPRRWIRALDMASLPRAVSMHLICRKMSSLVSRASIIITRNRHWFLFNFLAWTFVLFFLLPHHVQRMNLAHV